MCLGSRLRVKDQNQNWKPVQHDKNKLMGETTPFIHISENHLPRKGAYLLVQIRIRKGALFLEIEEKKITYYNHGIICTMVYFTHKHIQ